MRIAIDGTAPASGGGVTYLRDLVPALCAASPGDDFTLFVSARAPDPGVGGQTNCARLPVPFPRRGRVVWRFLWQQVILPWHLFRMKADVVLCPYDIAPLLAPCRIVLGVQNARPYGGPPAASWWERARHRALRALTRASAGRASAVFFVSEWSRRTISRAVGLPLERSCVISLGVSERFRPGTGAESGAGAAASPLAPSDVLVVGSLASHKDHMTVLDAWARILARRGGSLRMTIIGTVLEPAYGARVRSAAAPLGRTGAVAVLPETSREELVRLYQTARVLVMPSFVESFGLPPLEAMACGAAVIASDIPAAREICGEGAWYYRLGDPADLAAKLERLLADPRARAALAEAGSARARRFSWRRTAELTRGLLRGHPLPAESGTSVRAGAHS
jgi:glycosyltransferase involved in cell wall biosynthesis